MGDRHTLVNHTCYREGIMGRHDNTAVVFLCQLLNGLGNLGTHTHNDAGGIHLNRAQLRFITVPQNNHVTLMNVLFHYIRIRCCNDNFSFIIGRIDISQKKLCIQRLQNILIRGFCHGKNTVVIDIHIRIGNITNRNQSLQSLILCNWKCYHSQCSHHIPRFFQRNVSRYSLSLTDLNIRYICHYVCHVNRRLCLKIIQHILRLLVNLTCSGCTIAASVKQVFQFCIGNCRTNRIRVRILMSNHIYRCCICCHTVLLYISFFILALSYFLDNAP